MNPSQILMELQAAAARIMKAPLKEQKAAAVSQEVLDAMPHIYRVSGAKRQGRGGRRSVFQLQSSKYED